jgi:hypothetical protein
MELIMAESGLLTIGPRFGGAIDDAARYFKDAYDRGLSPYDFVESMKKKGIRVPGIGHRYALQPAMFNHLGQKASIQNAFKIACVTAGNCFSSILTILNYINIFSLSRVICCLEYSTRT